MKRIKPDLSIFQKLYVGARLTKDPRVPTWLKLVTPATVIAYLVSPVDLIPDVILGLGQVDDVGVLLAAPLIMANLLIAYAPRDVVRQYLNRNDDQVATAPSAVPSNEIIEARYRVVDENRR